MPSGYNEIPGVYSETPRPLAGIRKTFRTYKWCLGAIGCVILVLLAAALITVLISTSIDQRHSDELQERKAKKGTHLLLSLPWPRRDETWYKRRWESSHMRCPFQAGSMSSSSMNLCSYKSRRRSKRQAQDVSEYTTQDPFWETHSNSSQDEEGEGVGEYEGEYLKSDGSTYPEGDSFHWNREASHLPSCSLKDIGEAMLKSSEMDRRKEELEDELANSDISLRTNSPSFYHQKSFRKTSPEALKMARQGYRMDHATSEIARLLQLSKEDSTFDSRWLGDLNGSPYCEKEPMNRRCEDDSYRRVDGSCNNLRHPEWGMALSSFRRALPPDYDDGVMVPRTAKDGKELPNARRVSQEVHISKRVHSESYTHLLMSWGQFIDHDITATAQAKGQNGSSLACCHEDIQSNKTLKHPECFEILLPSDDAFFADKNKTCMEFSRSASASRCNFGPRDQMNQNTHFLDGSVIYGSTPEQLDKLRTHKEGLMRTQITIDGRQLLTPSMNANDSCNTEQQMYWKQRCFVSGDSRVNEHILLTVQHTVWTRQHNYVAVELREINPNWGDERLFQESRRIVVAQIQHVTYHEFLPSILGPKLSYGLKLSPTFSGEYWHGYDPTVHPGIANGFAAGAFRFGHSMIQGLMQSVDASGKNVQFQQLRKYFFNPFAMYDPNTIPNLVRGEVSQNAAAADIYFTPQVTNRLFQTPGNDYGLDLVAINIQRGRDHGIPSYTRWRMMCGLPVVRNFTDLKEDMDGGSLRAIAKIYNDVDDIDLYTGGLAEIPVRDGLVGPTFACIIADQFLRLKIGDRFWYENGPGRNALTKDQMAEIHKTSLARVLCNNIGGLGSIQHWPLRKFSTDNPRLPCSARAIPRMSLSPWEDKD